VAAGAARDAASEQYGRETAGFFIATRRRNSWTTSFDPVNRLNGEPDGDLVSAPCYWARTMDKPNDEATSRLAAEVEDDLEEEFELDLSETELTAQIAEIYQRHHAPTIDRADYFRHLLRLQSELIKLQTWVAHTGAKVLVLFEGRDSAGKGGAIKRITQRLNPRVCRVVALPAPNEREKTQWYFQRYVPHLPAAGEIVLFDRSWYNRAGVERVMGFATAEQVEGFFRDVPDFERMLVRSGIVLLKYWFSITDEEQQLRFLVRIHDPMKQWKLSPMDLQSRVRWEDYTHAKEEMIERTNTPEARWYIVEGNDKRSARLNCVHHLLQQIPYGDVSHEEVKLPERVFHADYERKALAPELYVPKVYG
jgi:polyphosphate kinase